MKEVLGKLEIRWNWAAPYRFALGVWTELGIEAEDVHPVSIED